jgi:hypothetical protein
MSSLPLTSCSQIVFYVEDVDCFDSRRRLAALRLAGRAFCSGASQPLFRHIIATAGSFQKISPLVGLNELSKSLYAVYVHQIDLGFQDFEHTTASHSLYVEDLAGVLPCCLVRLPNLNALKFHCPPLSLPQEKTRVFINTVVAALRYVPLLNLTALDITFPITYDFEQLICSDASALRIPIDSVLRNLRHLSLKVSQYTSHRGQRYWSTRVSPENAALPNDIYAIHLFRLVELAVNLNSLEICSTDLLSLDNIQFGRSLRLKSLDLTSVAVSSRTLLSLLEKCQESMRSVQLWRVELNSGTWQHVLLQMSKLPHLLDFAIGSSGYSSTGTSSHFALGFLPAPGKQQDIETTNFLDLHALGNLQRQVNANRTAAGISQISEFDYRHMQRQPLESVMEELSLGGQSST